ncbi:hypothetical protein GCM10018772_68580 [Streptomyces fumanus]|uniref:Uncharacterized protein n=1 Tax=Streptomyces fumanus TaxID=67302 RepID=A0A919EBX7_9ACTN|nr:hypothetical protein GCM10018772_68580 [Streptomyces fumanus]
MALSASRGVGGHGEFTGPGLCTAYGEFAVHRTARGGAGGGYREHTGRKSGMTQAAASELDERVQDAGGLCA